MLSEVGQCVRGTKSQKSANQLGGDDKKESRSFWASTQRSAATRLSNTNCHVGNLCFTTTGSQLCPCVFLLFSVCVFTRATVENSKKSEGIQLLQPALCFLNLLQHTHTRVLHCVPAASRSLHPSRHTRNPAPLWLSSHQATVWLLQAVWTPAGRLTSFSLCNKNVASVNSRCVRR